MMHFISKDICDFHSCDESRKKYGGEPLAALRVQRRITGLVYENLKLVVYLLNLNLPVRS